MLSVLFFAVILAEVMGGPGFSNGLAPRIIGGSPARLGQFPFMASLQNLRSDGVIFNNCGGTILSSLYILTAGHCLDALVSRPSIAVVGEVDLRVRTYSVYDIVQVIRHQNYIGIPEPLMPLQHDIAIVKLQRPIAAELFFSGRVQTVTLAKRRTAPGTEVAAVGWGRTWNLRRGSPLLLYVVHEAVSAAVCKQIHGPGSPISERNICASLPGACKGDSGGPLLNVATLEQVGITSWGPNNCVDEPAVYTEVVNYLPWISENTGLFL